MQELLRNILLYGMPLLAFPFRGFVMLAFFHYRNETLPEKALGHDTHRNMFLIFVAASFAGAMAIIVLEERLRRTLSWSLYYLIVCCLCGFIGFGLQSFTHRRWHDFLLTGGLRDAAILTLILTLADGARLGLSRWISFGLTTIAVVAWWVNHVNSVRLYALFLREKDRAQRSR